MMADGELPGEMLKQWQAVCKRALIPEPPSAALVELLSAPNSTASQQFDIHRTKISDFLRYVLKHGWEVE